MVVIFAVVVGIVVYALLRFPRWREGERDPKQGEGNKKIEIVWTAIPLAIVTTLFVLSARTMGIADPPKPPNPDIVVTGHQWWWEARYTKSGAVVANEIHISVGKPVALRLDAVDVLHEFWVPELARKITTVPGHPNHIWIQAALGAALNKSVLTSASPTSYQLSVEDPDLENRKRDYKQKLGQLPKGAADVVGYAFYVNGERNSVDSCASTKLFHQLWEKLLNIAILEAISAQNGKAAVPNKADVDVWLKRAAKAQPRDKKTAAPCTRLETKTYQNGVVFDTFDEAVGDPVLLHRNIISH
jgi:heme/copper-type cytochrome/quinol oxidase subunit 2